MSTAKRKIWAEHTESKKQKKRRKKAATETERKEDRLSDLPEELKLRILGCLDVKYAVQTSVLSRSCVSLWTRIPVLQFNHFSFRNNRRRRFSKLVRKVLNSRDPLAKLDTLKFNYYDVDPDGARCSAKILHRGFDYAFSHGVKHLKASMGSLGGTDSWPVSLCDSLTSLKLETLFVGYMLRRRFLGTRSVLFKNLTVLYLKGAEITDVEPFSGFPVLESLTLIDCNFWIKGDHRQISKSSVRVHAPRLSDLTIMYCRGVKCWELSTPRLRFMEYQGSDLMRHNECLPILKLDDEGLPVLETPEIVYNSGFYYYQEPDKRQLDDMLSWFSTLHNVKSLTLYLETVLLLLFYSDELVRQSSPFGELKDLKLCFYYHNCNNLLSWIQNASRDSFECVKAYLLQNSPQAKLTIDIHDSSWSKSCTCFWFLSL